MTDILEKCARAVMEFYHGSTGSSDAFVAHSAEEIARAVIAALADGVTEEMVQAFRAQWANSLSKHGETIDDVCARGLSAAIRAAIPEGMPLPPPPTNED